MKKGIKIALKIINSIIVTATVLVVVLFVGVKILGIQMFTVLSGSMEPEYPTGSLIYVKEVETDELQEGDVITFMLSETTTATHRIIEVVDDGDGTLSFKTKGDANEIEDAKPVYEENVIGTPIFTVPELGFLMNKIQNPPGRYVALGIAVALIFFVFITDSLTDDKKKKKGQESGSEDETEQNNQ